MLKKAVSIFAVIFLSIALGMEEDFVFVDSLPNQTTLSLPSKMMLNHYIDKKFSVIYPSKEQNSQALSDVYFFNLSKDLPTNIAFIAKQIFVVDQHDFNEKDQQHIYDINSLMLENVRTDTIYQVNLNNGVVVVLLSKILKQYDNLIFSSPNIVFTNKKCWEWANQPQVQKNNIFCDVYGSPKVELKYEKDYTIQDLQNAAKQSLEDSFVLMDDTSKKHWQEIIQAFVTTLKNKTSSVNLINNGLNVLHNFMQENNFQENVNLLSKEIQNQIKSLTAVAINSINIDLLRELWKKNAELAVPIINAFVDKNIGKQVQIMQSIASDWKEQGYELVDGILQKKDVQESSAGKPYTREIRYKDLEHATTLTRVEIPQQSENKNNLFYANLVDFLAPSVIKAPKITVYTTTKKHVFDELVKDEELKPQEIKMPEERDTSYLIDLSHNQNAHVLVMVQQNYLHSTFKPRLMANHITIVDQGIQQTLTTAENKIELIENNFSPLKENTIGLIKFDLLKNVFNLLAKDSTFDSYPKNDVNITQNTKMPNDLIDSYRQTDQSKKDNLSTSSLPQGSYDNKNVPPSTKEPHESDPFTLPVQQDLSKYNKMDKEPEETELDQLIKKLGDEWIKSFNEKLKINSENAYNSDLSLFDLKKCNELYKAGEELNEQLNKLSEDYKKKLDLLKLFWNKHVLYQTVKNECAVLITNNGTVFIVQKNIFNHFDRYGSFMRGEHNVQLWNLYGNELYAIDRTSEEFINEYTTNTKKILNENMQTLKSKKQQLLTQVENIVQTNLFDDNTKNFYTKQCTNLIGLSIGLTFLANTVNNQYTTLKPIQNVFFEDIITKDIKTNEKIVFIKTNDNFILIAPEQVLQHLNNYQKAELIWNFYIFNKDKNTLQSELQKIYNNDQFKPSSERLNDNNGNPDKNTIPLKPVKPQATWSWYKPWTWSWGGYYFKKESYENDRPSAAAQYYKDYGYEKEEL